MLITVLIALVILVATAVVIIFNPRQSTTNNISDNKQVIPPFKINNKDISYNTEINNSTQIPVKPSTIKDKQPSNVNINSSREEVLIKAQSMINVKWSPKQNIIDKYGVYVFLKGKTYYGVPYSMDSYQVTSSEDFLNKINNSNILYGNDCSGFVSAVWGLTRQTTLSFLNAVRNNYKIDGKTVTEISWNSLKPGDALLLDNGKGKGHIMLYISEDKLNKDKLKVYEQNVQTLIPFEPIPVAREDTRSKTSLVKEGYIPIRLMTLN